MMLFPTHGRDASDDGGCRGGAVDAVPAHTHFSQPVSPVPPLSGAPARGRGRWALPLLLALVLGCAGSAQEPHVFADVGQPTHRPFSLSAQASFLYASHTGAWTQPLQLRAQVIDEGPRRGPRLENPETGFLGMQSMVLRDGNERIVLQYDAPSVPVEPGQWVQVEAHTMRRQARLNYYLAVFEDEGPLLFAGLRGPDFGGPLPAGWRLEFGPAVRELPLCGGTVADRIIVVHGPSGQANAWPGHSSVAAIGEGGAEYAIEVARARSSEALCGRAAQEREISVVLRRVGERPEEQELDPTRQF